MFISWLLYQGIERRGEERRGRLPCPVYRILMDIGIYRTYRILMDIGNSKLSLGTIVCQPWNLGMQYKTHFPICRLGMRLCH